MKMGKFYPNLIGNIFYDPKGNIYGFHIVFDGSVAGRYEVHKKLIEKISKYNGMIRFLKIYQYYGTSDVVMILFLDLDDTNYNPEEIINSIKEVPYVKNAELIKPLMKGLIMDSYSFPQTFITERATIFRKTTYASWLKTIRERYGEGIKATQYHLGFYTGYDAYESLKKKYNTDIMTLIKIAIEIARALGYGIFEILEFSEYRVKVRVYDNFECELFNNSNKPESFFVRGVLAGWFAGIWGLKMNEIKAEETKCIAKGDPYCEYIIKRI